MRDEIEENIAAELKELAMAEHGELPIIVIEELLYDCGEGFPEFKSSETFFIDLEKLTDNMEFELTYVSSILEKALRGRTEATSSHKYSFTDTPDWWTALAPDSSDSRKSLRIEVKLNY